MRVELNLSSVGNAEIVMQAVHFAYHEFSGWLVPTWVFRMVCMNLPHFFPDFSSFSTGVFANIGTF